MEPPLNADVDLSLAEKDGWWYRRGLHDPDFDLVRATYREDEYHLADVACDADKPFVVIDVGAGIGTFARLALEKSSRAVVVAVEPNRRNIEVLTRNCSPLPLSADGGHAGKSAETPLGAQAGDIPNPEPRTPSRRPGSCHIVEAAVTYEPGPVGLLDSIYVGTTASGGSSVRPIADLADAAWDTTYIRRPQPLAKVTLEEIFELYQLDHVDVLKLDCEASEYSILRGAQPETLARIRLILGEYHDHRANWERLVAETFSRLPVAGCPLSVADNRQPTTGTARSAWRHISWNHHDHMGLFWLASPAVGEDEMRHVVALDHNHDKPFLLPQVVAPSEPGAAFEAGLAAAGAQECRDAVTPPVAPHIVVALPPSLPARTRIPDNLVDSIASRAVAGGLRRCIGVGVAYQPDRSARVDYGEAYWHKYCVMRGTPMADAINHVRVSLVEKYATTPLDVGIGSGEFLDRWQRPCYGYDINPLAARWLKSRRLFRNPYRAWPASADAMTMWDVLEHLVSPTALLRRVPSGVYLFVSVPTFGDLDNVTASRHYRPNEHLYYFTRDGLIEFIEAHDFICCEYNDGETKAGRDAIDSFVFLRR